MLTIADYYAQRTKTAPFNADDTAIIYDLKFNTYATVTQFIEENPDWAAGTETNVQVDTVGGLKVGAASSIASTTTTIESELLAANEGSIYFEVERLGITTDDLDIPTGFIQSSGRLSGGLPTTTVDFLFRTSSGSTDFINLSRQPGDAAAGQMRLNMRAGGGVVQNIDFFINSQRDFGMTDDEYQYAKLTISWKKKTVTIILDGLPVVTATLDNEFSATAFNRLTIGNQALSSPGNFGDYYIRRMQLCKEQSVLVANPMKLGIIGDSFMGAFSDGVDIGSMKDINNLLDGAGSAGQKAGIYSVIRKLSSEFNMVMSSITAGIACENESGYSSSIPNTIDATQWNHIVASDPEILIAPGSINDVNPGSPAPDIYNDTLVVLNTIIDGCRNLRQIHFFEQFPGHKGSTLTNSKEHIDEAARIRNIQSALHGYTRNNARGEPVTVIFHKTYDLFGGDDYNKEFSFGSATGNTFTANADIHPTPLGHIKIAEIIYYAIYRYITSTPFTI